MAEWEIVICAECGTPTTAQVQNDRINPPMDACRCGSKEFTPVSKGDI